MRVVHLFSNLHAENFHWLNSANIALLPKKEGVEAILDFRPISLTHGVAKIIAKMMTIRLAPHMNTLISTSQSAFIKTRSIHDNFLGVRNYIRRLHHSKTPTIPLKLDIKKAFDSVRWDYLLELMQCCGFPKRFRSWVTALLATASCGILLNGIPGEPIAHKRGLHQGDPLSPLLFDLVIDPLQQLLNIATHNGDLHRLRGWGPMVCTSLYADDATIFIAPFKEDFEVLAHIFDGFGEVTGVVTNVHKSIVVPIRRANIDLDEIMQSLPIQRANFLIKYLGLPLTHRSIKNIDVQPLVDKAASKLVPWHEKNIAAAGRCTLVKSVITSQAIFHITLLSLPPGTLLAFNKIERAFFWAATDKVSGGKCKLNWNIVCRPKENGGLGILDLDKFARALRLRWSWLHWKDPSKLGLEMSIVAMTKTWNSSVRRPQSPLEMGERLVFGTRRGSTREGPRKLHHPSLLSPNERTSRCGKGCTKSFGSRSLTPTNLHNKPSYRVRGALVFGK
jgi:hypothetical protein